MTKKAATKRQQEKAAPPEQMEVIDAGTLESGIYEPDDDVHQEFDEAQRLGESGKGLIRRKFDEALDNDAPIVGGEDPEANWVEANTSGDESVVGGNPSPEIDNVEVIGRAVGLEYQDNEPLHTTDKVSARDRDRWELDPASSEDYKERVKGQGK